MEDKILRLFKELIEKAMQREININFFGIRHKKKPDFISITQKEHYKQKIGVRENGRPFHGADSDGGVLIDVYIGDSRGLGRGSIAVEGVGRDESSIRRKIEPNLEEAIRKALADYSERAVASGPQDSSLFYVLSKEQIVESIDPIPHRSKNLIHEKKAINIEQQLKALWDLFCARKEIVKKAEIMIRSTGLVRRYVNSEGTTIRSHNFRAYYRINLDILAEDLRIIECSDTPYYAMTPEQIKKYNYVNNRRVQGLLEHISALAKTRPMIRPSQGTVKCPAYLGERAFSNFIHEPLAHPKEGSEKIGEPILPPFISVIDDPTYRFGHGYMQYDEEGVRGQKTILVKDGIRNDVLLDRLSAGKLGCSSNGHARGEWVYNMDEATGQKRVGIPERRVTNLFTTASNGVSTQRLFREFLENINKDGCEYGMIVRGGGAYIDSVTRDFVLPPFFLQKVYPDDRRELTSGARVLGDPTSFMKVVRCGKDNSRSFSNCGGDSGTIPDCSTGPAAYIKEVTFKEQPERRLRKKTV